jgi:hypothetical protein
VQGEAVSQCFTVVECEQRTPAWFAARAGVLTASEACDMLAKPLKSGGEPACRRDLRVRKALERLTGKPAEESSFVSFDMKRGAEMEPEAFGFYEAETGLLVRSVGFLRHNSLPVGCSPDGIVGDFDGGLELKCPKQATHWNYLRLGGALPADYAPQITHSLLTSGLPWWDFASYHPDFPESGRLYRVRVKREDVDLKAYELAAQMFWSEVERELDAMLALMPVAV